MFKQPKKASEIPKTKILCNITASAITIILIDQKIIKEKQTT